MTKLEIIYRELSKYPNEIDSSDKKKIARLAQSSISSVYEALRAKRDPAYKDHYKARRHKWRKRNIKEIRAKDKSYREENKNVLKLSRIRYFEKHPHIEVESIRKAKEKNSNSRKNATKHGKPYQHFEDCVIATFKRADEIVSFLLGRTIRSIQRRRWYLKQNGFLHNREYFIYCSRNKNISPHLREWLKNEECRKAAVKENEPYSEIEDEAVLKFIGHDYLLALMLKRTISSVRTRRCRLKRQSEQL